MKNLIQIYKPIGQTPLEAIEQFKRENPEYGAQKMAYAGRLDPMAEGMLLVLVGEECKKRKNYERLAKEYEFEVLFGFSTDTYDVMGLIETFTFDIYQNALEAELETVIEAMIGKQRQPYPPFSAARVDGKPLYYWARAKKLLQINVPTKEIEIFSIEVLCKYDISAQDLLKIIIKRVSSVTGEFRQREIIEKWNATLKNSLVSFPVYKLKVSCSSGMYVRSIANEIGRKLGIPALAFSIKRTRIGDFSLEHG